MFIEEDLAKQKNKPFVKIFLQCRTYYLKLSLNLGLTTIDCYTPSQSKP